jgi:8-oxo-dGTP diphosphatase
MPPSPAGSNFDHGHAITARAARLGMDEYDLRPCADALHARRHFQLTVDGDDLPRRWHTYETGDGDTEPIRFELYRVPVSQAHVVAGGQAALLGRIFD